MVKYIDNLNIIVLFIQPAKGVIL